MWWRYDTNRVILGTVGGCEFLLSRAKVAANNGDDCENEEKKDDGTNGYRNDDIKREGVTFLTWR